MRGHGRAKIRSNHPRPRKRPDQVRHLQRRLCAAAKRSPTRRFHALYDRIHRSDVLWEAWKRVKRNKGAAGVDRESIDSIARDVASRRGGFPRESSLFRRLIWPGLSYTMGYKYLNFAQASTDRRRSFVGTSRSRMGACARSASRRSVTGSSRWP